MYRVENKYNEIMVKTDDRSAAIKISIAFGEDTIGEIIDYANRKRLPFDGEVRYRTYPDNNDPNTIQFSTAVFKNGDVDDVEVDRFDVIFEG